MNRYQIQHHVLQQQLLTELVQNYKKLGYSEGLCPNAEEIYKGIMSIPLYPRMTDEDVHDVIHAVKKVVENYRR